MSQIATSLSDLTTELHYVPIPRRGKVTLVPIRELSEGEVWEIRRSVVWPKPPVKDLRKENGRVVTDYDYMADDYREAVNAANRLQAHRLLLASLQIEIPGETEDERLGHLKHKLGQKAFTHLVSAVEKLVMPSEEEIAAVADSFRTAGPTSTPGDGTAGDERDELERA